MAKKHAVSDDSLARALGLYAGMVGHVLTNPGRWLGLDDDPAASASLPARALDALRDRTLGEVTPASPAWGEQPLAERVDWWVKRIGVSAGFAAAAPRFAGALSDRFPLLSTVLFDRELTGEPASMPSQHESETVLSEPVEGEDQPGTSRLATLGRGARTAARTVWRLARAFLGIGDLLDERPRGSLFARGLGKLPVVGLAGGWLDERGGIRRAARETGMLLTGRPG